MSFKMVEWAFDVQIPSSPKNVLMALCRYYNEETGKCFPSKDTLKWCTGKSISTIQRDLNWLEEYGIIRIHYKVGFSSTYQIEKDPYKWKFDHGRVGKKPRNKTPSINIKKKNTLVILNTPPSHFEYPPLFKLNIPPYSKWIPNQLIESVIKSVIENGGVFTPLSNYGVQTMVKNIQPAKEGKQKASVTDILSKGVNVNKHVPKLLHQKMIKMWREIVPLEYEAKQGEIDFNPKKIAIAKQIAKKFTQMGLDADSSLVLWRTLILHWVDFIGFLKVHTEVVKAPLVPDLLFLSKYLEFAIGFDKDQKGDKVKLISQPSKVVKEKEIIKLKHKPITLEELEAMEK